MANRCLNDVDLRDYEEKIEKLLKLNSQNGKACLFSISFNKNEQFDKVSKLIGNEVKRNELSRNYEKQLKKNIKPLFCSKEPRSSSYLVFLGRTSNREDIFEMFRTPENACTSVQCLDTFDQNLLSKILPSSHCKGVVVVSEEEVHQYILTSEKLDECGLIVLNGLSNERKQQHLNGCFKGKQIGGIFAGFSPGCEWMKASFADAVQPVPCFIYPVQEASKGEAEFMLTKTSLEADYLIVRELKNIYEFFHERNNCEAMTRTGLQPSLEAFEDGSADILLLHESVKGEVFIYKDSERKASRVLVVEPGMAMPATPEEEGFRFRLSDRSEVRAWLELEQAVRSKSKVSVTLVKNHTCREQEVLALGGACAVLRRK